MPITEELKNVKKFESVGFSHEQAEALAESLEQAQINGQESLKEFIRSEIGTLRIEFSNEFKNVHDQFGAVQSQFKDIHSEFGAVQSQFKDIHSEFGAVQSQFKDIHSEFGAVQSQFKDIHSQFKDVHKEINASELRMKAAQTDLLVKIFGIVVGTVGVAVTILKLFP